MEDDRVEKLYIEWQTLNKKRGYYFNPDTEAVKMVLKGLCHNQDKYGYMSCPCRLATGDREKDKDMICPCNYRDADLLEHGSCFCGLYMSREAIRNDKKIFSIPERRNKSLKKEIEMNEDKIKENNLGESKLPIWRCEVCGYLCAREEAPEICPICGAEHDRFEKFIK